MPIDLPLLSYVGALQFLINGNDVLQRGYDKVGCFIVKSRCLYADRRTQYKDKGGVFKVPEFFRWHVIVTGRALVEELRKANDDELNFDEGVKDVRGVMNDLLHFVLMQPAGLAF